MLKRLNRHDHTGVPYPQNIPPWPVAKGRFSLRRVIAVVLPTGQCKNTPRRLLRQWLAPLSRREIRDLMFKKHDMYHGT